MTKIILKPPYDIWKNGYLNVNPEGRRTLALYNSHKDRTSTQYARYLMAVRLGRFLTKKEHIDHIDNDKTNDDIDNLQILSLRENNIKTHKKPDVELNCPVCKKDFIRTRTQLRGRKHKINDNTICCSRRCGAKFRTLGSIT